MDAILLIGAAAWFAALTLSALQMVHGHLWTLLRR
jgi:hypothetical protein